MGRALPLDLRERVVAAVDGGMSCRAAAACFGVGVSSAIRWRQQQLVHGHLKPGRPGGDVPSAALEAHRGYLLAFVEETSDLTPEEIRDALAGRGMSVSVASVWRFRERHQITRKKRPRTPAPATATIEIAFAGRLCSRSARRRSASCRSGSLAL